MSESDEVNKIIASLQTIYNPQTENSERHKAEAFLETIKAIPESPFWGYQLALPDNKYDYVVRHYGLNLLLGAIRKSYFDWDMEKKLAVRYWVVELASKVTDSDPHYMKEKIAFLWVEIAKRCWGQCLVRLEEGNDTENGVKSGSATEAKSYDDKERLESWTAMDSNLVEMWQHGEATKELTLTIFRTLFEDVYLLEDPIVSERSSVLSSLCPEVVTSEAILLQKYEPSEPLRMFAASGEGWLSRWSSEMDTCIKGLENTGSATPAQLQTIDSHICHILEVFKTCLYWVLPMAFREAGILEKLSAVVKVGSIKSQTLAVDCLQVLFTRTYGDREDFEAVVGSIMSTEGLSMLLKLYRSIQLDANDIDEASYTLMKKLVEMIVGLSEYLGGEKDSIGLPKGADVENYYKLVLETTRHESLVVSGLSLQLWCSVLRLDELSGRDAFQTVLPGLLETSANRLLSYGDMDEDSTARLFLAEDFENEPERAAFLANYRKLNEDVVRISVCKQPRAGLQWLAQRLNAFCSSEVGHSALSEPSLTYKGKGAEPFVVGYAQFVVIEACVRGISRWQIWYTDADKAQKQSYLIGEIDSLCQTLLTLAVADPALLRKQIQTLVQFTPLLKGVPETMFKVLEKVMASCTYEYPANADDDQRELIRDLRTSGGTELNRLAYLMPEALKGILPQLEEAISGILSSGKLSAHEAVAFKSFLLVVSQRSSVGDKPRRFSEIVDTELRAWTDPDTEKGLADLHWFMERLGIVKIAEYFDSRGITPDTDLLSAPMDERGRQLKSELKERWASVFPIRATRIFIQYSIEKLPHTSADYQALLALWKPRVQPILPHVLQLIYQIQAYHNPANWTSLPPSVQSFVRYSCQERFWQQGVSMQSKESFMDESVKAMRTLRDFADSLGHIVRYTREYAYLTIASISQLEGTLYEVPGCAEMLWNALTGQPEGITLHSWRHMLNLVVRNVVKNCPLSFIDSFLAELMPLVLTTIDSLLADHWAAVYRRGVQLQGNESDEQMSREMMDEHMLRQLTAVVDRLLIDLVGQQSSQQLSERQRATRRMLMSDSTRLAPLLNLLGHIILLRDTRCSFNAILVLKHLLPELLALDNPEVSKYLADDILRALLGVLDEKFFTDVHPEAATTLAALYMGLRYASPYPASVLQQILSLTDKELAQFEQLLTGCKKVRGRRNCFLQLVSAHRTNGEDSTGSSSDDAAQRKDRQRRLDASRRSKRGKAAGSLIDDPFSENNALSTLFGGE